MDLLSALDRAHDAWIAHRRWCGYCHVRARTLCPLGKVLLNDYWQADARCRAQIEPVPVHRVRKLRQL